MILTQMYFNFCFVLLFTYVSQTTSVFNIEELKQINYEVEILPTPLRKDEHTLPAILMKSKFGQEYKCILPVVEDEGTTKKETLENEKSIDIKDLLKPMQSGTCLLKVQDWWTYEICLGLYVKQFHIEEGHISGQVITLGLYENDFDWNNETNRDKFKHLKQPYHSQWYVNGTKCDLTGQPRNAEIRLVCDPDGGDYVYRVDEHATCSYIITIHTPRICTHPQLKPVLDKKVHTIPCHPVLNEEQYNNYLKKLKETKELEDEKRNQWLKDQQKRLETLKEEQAEKEKVSSNNIDEKVMNEEVYSKENAPIAADLITAVEGPDETLIAKEYDEEIEKLKTYLSPDKFAIVRKRIQGHFDKFLQELKSGIKQRILRMSVEATKLTKQAQGFFNEAESDQSPEVGGEAKIATLQKLMNTLNVLLSKLDQAEKDAKEATEELMKAKEMISKPDEQESNDVSKVKRDAKSPSVDEGSPKASKADQISATGQDEIQVRIKKLGSTDAEGKLYEMSSSQTKQLEKVVAEKLQKSGWTNGDRKIEVKIITAANLNNGDGQDLKSLTEEESIQFQNMILAMLTGQSVKETERQKRLEENYKRSWENEEEKDD